MFLARCFEFERAIPGLDRFGEGSFCLKTHNCPYSISSLGLGHKPGFCPASQRFPGYGITGHTHTHTRTHIYIYIIIVNYSLLCIYILVYMDTDYTYIIVCIHSED